MSRITALLSCVALFCLITVSNANADPIAVSGGTIWATGLTETGPGAFTGFPGFSFVGGVVPLEGRVDPFMDCNPCLPGAKISVGANLSGAALPGTVGWNGTMYDVGSASSAASLMLEFAGSIIAPSLSGFPTTITAPFTTTGSLFVNNTTHSIIGKGIASVLFRRMSLDENSTAWFADQVTYNFTPTPAPVPEPATLGMVGFGLVALARAVQKRKRTRQA